MTDKRPVGKVLGAELLEHRPHFIPKTSKLRGAKAAGKRYEKKVLDFLDFACQCAHEGENWTLVRGPWLKADTVEGVRYLQPDGLLMNFPLGQIIICEIKYTLCQDAVIQLKDMYLPVVRRLFPPWRLGTLCIYRISRSVDAEAFYALSPFISRENAIGLYRYDR